MLAEHQDISGSFMFLFIKKKPPRASFTKRFFFCIYLSTKQLTRLLVNSFTRQLNNQLVYLSTCLLVNYFTTFILVVPIFTIITPDADGA